MTGANNQTRRERLEAREEAIVSAAHDEFAEHGFDGARIAGIARRAGVAEGTLYLYFRNKGALLAAVVAAFYQRLTAAANEGIVARKHTEDRLAFLAGHHLRSCLAEWSILVLAMPAQYQTGRYRESEYFDLNRTYVAVFDTVIREGIARGDLREDLPLHVMRDLFFGTLEHAVRTIMVRAAGVPGDRELEVLAEQVMAMVRPAFGIAAPPAEASDRGLGAIARRLETAVGRLEAISQDGHAAA